MSFLDNLGKDEEVVMQANVHRVRVLFPGIIAFLFVLFGIAFMSEDSSMAIFFIVLGVLLFLSCLMHLYRVKLIITSKRVYGKVGIIRTKTLDTPLSKVNTVSVSSGLIGKIFGYGSISITSSSGQYKFDGIKEPNLVRQALLEQIDRFDEERIKKQAAEMAKAIRG